MPAQETTSGSSGVVELPPMLVEESVSSVPWLYVNVDGTEFLSRCSASTTRHLVKAWCTGMQLVRVFVPPEFLAQLDVPAVFVLYAQDMKQTVSAEIQRELQGPSARGDSTPGARVGVAPSMRLSDRDMHASIAYIDESQFEAYALSVAPGHVGFLLRGRVPVLPAWLVEGIERCYRNADFMMEPITLRPMIWNNSTDSDALSTDPTRPRAVLPANELFAPDAWRGLEKQHPRRVQARDSTQELFFRWAMLSDPATRSALWQLAARAGEGPVTEEMFESIFGFDYAELRDRLSDYLPRAVGRSSRIAPGKLPPLPPIEVERATPNQIARVRGEWERLAIGHVQRRLPQVREPYIVQARRTLRRAYDAGDRDPRLLATMGLCEVDAGNDAAAREFLDPAVMAGVVRPRAYHELARLRLAELKRTKPDATSFSYTDLAAVIEPLRRGVKQSPPLPESFALLAEAWGNCEYAPNTAEFAELEAGLRLFVQRPAVVLPIARALAHHGRKVEAATALEATIGYAMDAPTRAAITRLRAELLAAPPAEQR